jgi:hypothetical protein
MLLTVCRNTFALAITVSAAILVSPALVEASWSFDIRLTDYPSVSLSPSLCGGCSTGDPTGVLHLVWYDNRDGNEEVYYRRFDGLAWGENQRLTLDAGRSTDPCVAATPDGHVHVVWSDDRDGNSEIYYKEWDGLSWNPDQRLTNAPSSSVTPSLTADPSGKIHVVWSDRRDGNNEIYYKMSDGVAWTPDSRLTDVSSTSLNPKVAADDSGHLHVVWDDLRDGNYEIYYKTSDGLVWGGDQRLTLDAGISVRPAICAHDVGHLHVVWGDNRDGNSEIYYKEFDGVIWSDDLRLTDASGVSTYPDIMVDDSLALHVIWEDRRDGNYEVYYKTYDGVLWGSDVRLTDAGGASSGASGCLDTSGNMHIVWSDARHGHGEIYWKEYFSEDPPKPELVAIEPFEGPTGEGVNITRLEGSAFLTPVEILLLKSGEPAISASDIVLTSSTTMTCSFSLGGAPTGYWDVALKNMDGQTDTLASGFRVMPGMWGDDLRLTETSNEYLRTCRPNARSIAADSEGNVHVVWTTASAVCYLKHNGTEWCCGMEVTSGGFNCGDASVATYGSKVHVVWHDERNDDDYEIYYRQYDGTTWLPMERLTNAPGMSKHASTAVDGEGNLHVVWQDVWDVHYKRCDSTGWSPEENVTNTPTESRPASIAIDGSNNLHLVWREHSGGASELRYKKFDGLNWSSAQILTSADDIWFPSLAADADGALHVAWYDHRFGENPVDWGTEVFYKKFDGMSWGPDEMISSDPATSTGASVASDGNGVVYVVWCDTRDGIEEIYYRRFDGLAWEPETRLTFVPSFCSSPCAAIDASGKLHVVWRDDRQGHAAVDVYYKLRDPAVLSGVDTQERTKGPICDVRAVPNPVRDGGSVRFDLEGEGPVSVSVYDTMGRLIWRKISTVRNAGPNCVTWDGRNPPGVPVAPGVYFVKFRTETDVVSTKVVVLK